MTFLSTKRSREDGGEASRPCKRRRAAPLDLQKPKFVIVGECGDGKSSLIKGVMIKSGYDPATSDLPVSAIVAQGVTKEISAWPAKTSEGIEVLLLDTPGVGDKHVTMYDLLEMLSYILANGQVDGIIVCNAVTKGRVTIGAQTVCALIQEGVVKYSSAGSHERVIFVGTQADRLDEDEMRDWRKSIPDEFNTNAGFKEGASAHVVSASCKFKKDNTPKVIEVDDVQAALDTALKSGASISYKRPEDSVMVAALAKASGLKMEDKEKVDEIKAQLAVAREKQAEWEAKIDEHKKQFDDIRAAREADKEKYNQEKTEFNKQLQLNRDKLDQAREDARKATGAARKVAADMAKELAAKDKLFMGKLAKMDEQRRKDQQKHDEELRRAREDMNRAVPMGPLSGVLSMFGL